MKIEEKLEKFKKVYSQTQPPEHLMINGWEDIASRLPEQIQPTTYHFFPRIAAFAVVTLFVLGGTVITAQAAKPNEFLYPVKALSDKVVAVFIDKPHIKIEKSADEVIKTSHESPQQLDEAQKEYEKTLDDAKRDVKGATDKKELEKSLDHQIKKLKQLSETKKSSSSAHTKTNIEQAIQKTEEVKSGIQKDQGKSEEHRNNDNKSSSPQDNSNGKK